MGACQVDGYGPVRERGITEPNVSIVAAVRRLRSQRHEELAVKEDGMRQHQPGIQAHWHRARGNREYVRRLLSHRQPELFAVLQSTERHIQLELSCETGD
jgi:hypothetical protein